MRMSIDLANRDAMALTAARMYHQSGQTTDEIARYLGVSRSTVSRLLAYGRDVGMVRVEVRTDHAHGGGARLGLQSRFPEVTFHVVEVRASYAPARIHDTVAQYAAHIIGERVERGSTIGLAWGNMLTAIVGHLQPRPIRELDVVQLNGAGNRRNFGIRYASDIVTGFAQAFGGTDHLFPVPAFFDHPSTKRALWRERSVQRILALQRSADTMLFSVGGLGGDTISYVYSAGYLTDEEVRELRDDGAVGDIATVFYTGSGQADLAINARSSGPPLDLYRGARQSICVASGLGKVPGLLGALRAGCLTDLITDELTATELAHAAREADPIAAAVARA
jgi:deoxyribonucleoside regulator